MKILVTGSQGTLGRPLVRELRRRGHDVYGCDLRHSEDPQETRADVADYRQLERVFDDAAVFPMEKVHGFDLVYHLAAEFGRHNGQEYYEQLWRTNQIGTRNVIELCKSYDSRLILAGSSEAYGEGIAKAYYRGQGGDLSDYGLREQLLDSTVGTFHNEYALSKWAQERQVMIAAKNSKEEVCHRLNAVILRFFNAYGPGEYYTPYRSVVCLFCYRLMFGIPITVYRNYHRVFMYVDDMMQTLANAAERFDSLPEKVYNVGGEEYRSVEELVSVITNQLTRDKLFVSHVEYEDKESANVTNKRPNIDLARRDLGHDPKVTLEEGVARTIAWMREAYDENGRLRQGAEKRSVVATV